MVQEQGTTFESTWILSLMRYIPNIKKRRIVVDTIDNVKQGVADQDVVELNIGFDGSKKKSKDDYVMRLCSDRSRALNELRKKIEELDLESYEVTS